MIKVFLFILVLPFTNSIDFQTSFSCDLCHYFVEKLQINTPIEPLISWLEQIAYKVCTKKHIQADNVCAGAIKEMTTHIIKGVWKHFTNPHKICQSAKFCQNEYAERDLQADIQEIIKNPITDRPNKEWEKPTGRKNLKIMHISDVHPDYFYAEGTPVKCTEPVCCRPNSIPKDNSTEKAGYWGEIAHCDLPMHTFDIFVEEAKKLQLDAIIWTGDNTPHDIWSQTQEYNLNFTTFLSEKLKKVNTTLIPVMGNHESFPVNVYDYDSDREHILNAGLAEAWSPWLDSKAVKMQREKGFYSQVYPQLNNVKVITINTQVSNDENWLLLQDPTDPGHFLEWLQQELMESEKNNEFVYFVGHIPTQSSLNEWAMRFNAIIDRFSYIVRGQFYGHRHSDHIAFNPRLKDISNIENATLSNYYLVAPSLTTYENREPEYRVMEIDYDTLQVLDFQQYRLDLKKFTSKDQNPAFEILYSFKESYGIKDMSIEGGITELRNKLRDNPETQKIYTQHQCGGLCEGYSNRTAFCDTTTSKQFKDECNGKAYKKSFFELFAGPWIRWLHQT